MCGICGIVSTAELDKRRAEQMVALLRHRGPDASGIESINSCVLGHTRLRIIDVRQVADQPIRNEDRSIMCVFNGEIYNFPELKAELKSTGHIFRTETDGEVLVHLYEEHGPHFIRRLRGMFAFALWDDRKSCLLLVRDRLGIKPLYYSNDPADLRFASEAKALVQGRPKLNRAALAGYLRFGWVPAPRTIYEGVYELPPGHLAQWSFGRMTIHRWWEPPHLSSSEESSRVGELGPVLSDSFRRHLVSDVPVGLFLSSGLDSIALAYLAFKAGATLQTFTIAFDEGLDESEVASAIAARLSLPHKTIQVRGSDVLQDLPQIVSDMDQPTVDGINTWLVARGAKQAGVTVGLSGLGGDELFEGYSTYRRAPMLYRLGRLTSGLPPCLGRKTATIIGSRAPHTFKRSFEGIMGGSWEAAYAAMRGVTGDAEHRSLLPGLTDGTLGDLCVVDGSNSIDVVTQLELRNYLPQQLLRDTDIMGMAHSMEIRLPLLDDEVLFSSLYSRVDLGGRRGKRRLAAAVDPELFGVAASPKKTFSLPLDQWLRGPLANVAKASLARLTEPDVGLDVWELSLLWDRFIEGQAHWRTMWALTSLGLWVDDHLSSNA